MKTYLSHESYKKLIVLKDFFKTHRIQREYRRASKFLWQSNPPPKKRVIRLRQQNWHCIYQICTFVLKHKCSLARSAKSDIAFTQILLCKFANNFYACGTGSKYSMQSIFTTHVLDFYCLREMLQL